MGDCEPLKHTLYGEQLRGFVAAVFNLLKEGCREGELFLEADREEAGHSKQGAARQSWIACMDFFFF